VLNTIKICGVKDLPVLKACIQVGVGFIGFNFVQKSPRYIDIENAAFLGLHTPHHIKKVALCVNETNGNLETIIRHLNPDYLQLHGYESRQRVQEIKAHFNIPIIKAVGIENQKDIDESCEYFDDVDMMLFDAKPA